MTPPSPYRERYPGAPYDAEIAAVDEAVGRTLTALEDHGVADRTLVILVADHGESLGEHGEMTHAVLVYSPTMRVPLIVRDPARPGPQRVNTLVSIVDILPTVLHRLGLPIPAVCQGRPLPMTAPNDAPPSDRRIYGESLYAHLLYGWSPLERLTTDRWMLIHGPARDRLYHVQGDPSELTDLSESHAEQVERMVRMLEEERDLLSGGQERFSQGTVSAENQARLEALGYLGSAQPVSEEAVRGQGGADPHDMMDVLGLIMEGRNLAENGITELAIPVLRRAEARDPDNPWIVRELAISYLDRGEVDRAREATDRLLELQAEHLGTMLVLAEYERARGDLDAARRTLERAVELDPQNIATRITLAHLLEDLGRLVQAETAYREVLGLEPSETLALNGLATLLLREQRVDEGVALLETLMMVQPYYPPVHLNMAVVEYDRGHYRESLRLARRSLELRPGQLKALEVEAMALEALDRPREAAGSWHKLRAAAEDPATLERADAAIERLE
jgi:Flp pilus assembly protein TadD